MLETPAMSDPDTQRRRLISRALAGAVLLAVLAPIAAIYSQRSIATLHNQPSAWVPDDVPVKAEFLDFYERFQVADVLLISWPGCTLNSDSIRDVADTLRPLAEEVADAPDEPLVNDIRELTGVERPLMFIRSGAETIDRLTSSPVDLSRAAAVARLKGTLVGPDGETTCLIVSLGEEASDVRQTLVPVLRERIAAIVGLPTEQIAMVGGPLDGATVDSASIATIQRFSPIASGVAAVLCLLCLRSLALTAVTVAVAVVGQGLVLAMVYFASGQMNAILIVLPPLVFVLTVSAGIHLSNYYLDIEHDFPSLPAAEAATRALRAGVMPCVLATATTVVGLGSLLLVRLAPVRVFGVVASLGVSLTLLLLVLLLPAAMLWDGRRKKIADGPKPDGPKPVESAAAPGGFGRFVRKALTQPWPIIFFFAILTGLTAAGLTNLHSSVNVPRMFLPESDLRQQYAWFESNVGPTATGDVVLRYPAVDDGSTTTSLDRLNHVKRVHAAIRDVPDVGGVLSVATFFPRVPRPGGLAATGRRNVLAGLLDDPDSSIRSLGFVAADDEHQAWRVTVRLFQSEDANFRPEIDAVREAARDAVAELDDPPEVMVTGHIVIVEESQAILLSDLFKSFIAAFGVIAVVMIAMLRSVVGGLLAMLPNLFPTVVMFGTMGLVGLPLDIGSVMSASVALGIAVDDTVHLLSRYGARRSRGLGQIRAAHGALLQCGWAMLHTTIVCGISLMAYYFSDFVPTSRFALFMFALLTSALLGVLILLPAMMASPLGRFLSRAVGGNAESVVTND